MAGPGATMRIDDAADYFELRRLAENPWQVLRFRKNRRVGDTLAVQRRDAPPLHLRGGHADFHMFHRIFLRDEYRLDALGRLGDVVDLGGNVGLFAARAAGRARRVVSIEPSPEIFERLTLNVGKLENVVPVCAGVAGSAGTLRLYRPARAGLSGSSSMLAETPNVSAGFDEVPTTTLDALFETYAIRACELLKIDIEGMEYETLLEASEDTLARISRIHGEYHPVGDDPARQIESLMSRLATLGFAIERLPHRRKRNHGMFFAARPEA